MTEATGDTEAANDEGASPADDLKQQNPGEKTTPDQVEGRSDADSNKVENLTKQGRDIDPDDGAD